MALNEINGLWCLRPVDIDMVGLSLGPVDAIWVGAALLRAYGSKTSRRGRNDKLRKE